MGTNGHKQADWTTSIDRKSTALHAQRQPKEQDKKRALDAGFDAHLTKPADPAVLERILAAPRQTHVP
jgi:CheY-like chemotaxis protein